jgi:hypothetical protein
MPPNFDDVSVCSVNSARTFQKVDPRFRSLGGPTMVLLGEGEWLAFGTFIATAALAILTAVYVYHTAKLVRAQTDPCVIAYTQRTERNGVAFVEIVIENVGRGIARDARVERSVNVDNDKWNEFLNGATICSGFRDTLLRPIPALCPGRKLVIPWRRTDMVGLSLGDGLPIVCKCNRVHQSDDPVETEVRPVECYLEMYPVHIC